MSKASIELMNEIQLGIPAGRRRLSFPLKCAAFAAVARGFPQMLVAKALSISPAAVSYLAGAQKYHDKRYQDVLAEYARLGHDEFCSHYITDEIAERFQRFRMGVETDEDVRARQGPDPKADKYADRPFELTRLDGSTVTLVVSFRPSLTDDDPHEYGKTLPPGWAWRELVELEIFHHRYTESRPQWSRRRERGSSAAVDGAFEDHGLDPPLMEFKQTILLTHRMEPK